MDLRLQRNLRRQKIILNIDDCGKQWKKKCTSSVIRNHGHWFYFTRKRRCWGQNGYMMKTWPWIIRDDLQSGPYFKRIKSKRWSRLFISIITSCSIKYEIFFISTCAYYGCDRIWLDVKLTFSNPVMED